MNNVGRWDFIIPPKVESRRIGAGEVAEEE
jgi:hypothetical protein